MKIHSKFRTLYLIRINMFYIIFDFFCLSSFFNSFRTEDFIVGLGSIIFLALSIFFHIDKLRSVTEIIVLEKGLQKISLASQKTEFIPFSFMVNIRTERIQGSYSDAGQITTGYFESTILLENGEELLISPDQYDNYKEIVVAIRDKI
ncbi:hypothetical protein EAH81_09485 [Flavobacterium pectinovorum]|uniref:Uncharacterized protein n=2 Tax=Flavobacterium pectinovorum TaxID=29533 RepID=A0A502EX58_9FLAO|nr:hypothetical protein EAH81_09485 [Flavobacterium pectinovorum]